MHIADQNDADKKLEVMEADIAIHFIPIYVVVLDQMPRE